MKASPLRVLLLLVSVASRAAGSKEVILGKAAQVSIPRSAHNAHTRQVAEPPNCNGFDTCVRNTGDASRCSAIHFKGSHQAAGLCVKAACVVRADFCTHPSSKARDKYCELCYELAHKEQGGEANAPGAAPWQAGKISNAVSAALQGMRMPSMKGWPGSLPAKQDVPPRIPPHGSPPAMRAAQTPPTGRPGPRIPTSRFGGPPKQKAQAEAERLFPMPASPSPENAMRRAAEAGEKLKQQNQAKFDAIKQKVATVSSMKGWLKGKPPPVPMMPKLPSMPKMGWGFGGSLAKKMRQEM